jgi:hypothetical protein
VDTQGFPLCHITPSRLSFWEEVKVKMKIDENSGLHWGK